MVTARTSKNLGTDLLSEQARDVEAMKDCLLSFRKDDPLAAKKAIQNVTILRVYHQVERIVRYLDMIDKLEDRIYQSLDAKLMNSDPDAEDLCYTLIPIQERLQKMMVESHKLLEPYLSMEQLSTFEVPQKEDPSQSFTSMILDQESREKVRTSAQELIAAISNIEKEAEKQEAATEESAQEDSVQSMAQQALLELDQSEEQSEVESKETES